MKTRFLQWCDQGNSLTHLLTSSWRTTEEPSRCEAWGLEDGEISVTCCLFLFWLTRLAVWTTHCCMGRSPALGGKSGKSLAHTSGCRTFPGFHSSGTGCVASPCQGQHSSVEKCVGWVRYGSPWTEMERLKRNRGIMLRLWTRNPGTYTQGLRRTSHSRGAPELCIRANEMATEKEMVKVTWHSTNKLRHYYDFKNIKSLYIFWQTFVSSFPSWHFSFHASKPKRLMPLGSQQNLEWQGSIHCHCWAHGMKVTRHCASFQEQVPGSSGTSQVWYTENWFWDAETSGGTNRRKVWRSGEISSVWTLSYKQRRLLKPSTYVCHGSYIVEKWLVSAENGLGKAAGKRRSHYLDKGR